MQLRMTFDCEGFIANPSVTTLESSNVRKDDWIKLAVHYDIEYRRVWKKSELKNAVIRGLVSQGVLDDSAFQLCERMDGSSIEIMKLELERDKLRLEDRERERQDRERERQFQLDMMTKKIQLGVKEEPAFDYLRVGKLVPKFDETDPEEFFLQFENMALTLKWPVPYWPLLVQSVLVGKGRSTYLALTSSQQQEYSQVKDAILKSYQLTSEYYRNKFRNAFKEPNQSYIEYGHVVTKLRNRWISSSGVKTISDLEELIALEQYLRGVPYDVRVFLCEKEVNNVERAATLAENFNLIHRNKKIDNKPSPTPAVAQNQGGRLSTGGSKPFNVNEESTKSNTESTQGSSSYGGNRSSSVNEVKGSYGGNGSGSGRGFGCNYCKKLGHFIADCPKLRE